MNRIPWKGIGIGCAIMTVLVIARCAATAGRVLYYGGDYWMEKILADPWFYVGMAAAAICVVSFVVLAYKAKAEENISPIEYDEESRCEE